jgi:hypothetical protein
MVCLKLLYLDVFIVFILFSESEAEEANALLNAGLNNQILFGLPTPSNNKISNTVVYKTSITDDDVHVIMRVADLLMNAKESMKINDENIPPLVVQLPSIEV